MHNSEDKEGSGDGNKRYENRQFGRHVNIFERRYLCYHKHYLRTKDIKKE
jgi:hypothetical protein